MGAAHVIPREPKRWLSTGMDQHFPIPIPYPAPERRQYMRKLLRTVAQLVIPDAGLIEVQTTDISLGGIGVVMNTDPVKGATFLLRVALRQPDRTSVVLQARVVVANSFFGASEGGFKVGLRFVDLTPAANLVLSKSVF